MSDVHVDLLINIITRKESQVWAVNLGELPNISRWNDIIKALSNSIVTHMYVSEQFVNRNYITKMRDIIHLNVKKHALHNDKKVKKNVTHMWKNKIT